MFEFLRKPAAAVDAQTAMTPLEAAANPKIWRELFRTDQVPPKREVKRFRRTEVHHSDVRLYSAGAGASTLIVGFCGRRARLMMPIAITLQHLDDCRYDLLTVYDRRHLHYDAGVEGFAESLPELARRLSAIIEKRGYSSVITYGTSMGGLPALRLGRLLEADRAVSAGGRFVWHISRLVELKPTIGAFDLICDCRAPSRTRCYALFSHGSEEDAEGAARVAAIMPQSGLAAFSCAKHNFAFELFRKGVLAQYHGEVFGLEREPDLERLAAISR